MSYKNRKYLIGEEENLKYNNLNNKLRGTITLTNGSSAIVGNDVDDFTVLGVYNTAGWNGTRLLLNVINKANGDVYQLSATPTGATTATIVIESKNITQTTLGSFTGPTGEYEFYYNSLSYFTLNTENSINSGYIRIDGTSSIIIGNYINTENGLILSSTASSFYRNISNSTGFINLNNSSVVESSKTSGELNMTLDSSEIHFTDTNGSFALQATSSIISSSNINGGGSFKLNNSSIVESSDINGALDLTLNNTSIQYSDIKSELIILHATNSNFDSSDIFGSGNINSFTSSIIYSNLNGTDYLINLNGTLSGTIKGCYINGDSQTITSNSSLIRSSYINGDGNSITLNNTGFLNYSNINGTGNIIVINTSGTGTNVNPIQMVGSSNTITLTNGRIRSSIINGHSNVISITASSDNNLRIYGDSNTITRTTGTTEQLLFLVGETNTVINSDKVAIISSKNVSTTSTNNLMVLNYNTAGTTTINESNITAIGAPIVGGYHFNNTLTAAATNNTSGGAYTTLWTVPVVTGRNYKFRILYNWQSTSAANGFVFDINPVTAAGQAVGSHRGYNSTLLGGVTRPITDIVAIAFNTVTNDMFGTVNTPVNNDCEFVFRCTTTGSIEIRFRAENGGSTSQVNIGSTCIVERVDSY